MDILINLNKPHLLQVVYWLRRVWRRRPRKQVD
jgi:hypothetical protein